MVVDVLLGFGKLYWVGGKLKEGVGPDGEEFAECGEEWVGSGFGGERTVLEDDAVFCGGCCERFEDLAADGIEDDSCAFAFGDRLDAEDKVLFVGDDDVVSTEFEQLCFFRGGAGDGDAGGAPLLWRFQWRRCLRCCWRL